MARRLTGFEWACLGVIAAAFLLRLDLVRHPDIIWDSGWYLLLARSFADTGTFVMPWTDPPQYNGYWPPLYPMFLSPLVKVFGPSYGLLVAGASLATALLTLAVFLCTRDLYGRTRAFAAATLVAANPAFFISDSRGMSESTLALAITLTVWAFLKSLKQPRWLAAAGAFAVLAYFGKPNLGAPFVAAGLVAIAGWRIATRGWRRVLTSRIDLAAGAIALAGIVALVVTRTGKLGGLGLSIIAPVEKAWLHPDSIQVLGLAVPYYVAIFPFKLFFAAAFLAAVTLPFALYAPSAWRRWRDEQTGALWLAVLIPLVAGAVFTTTFYMTEKRSLVDFDNIRYLTPAIVPAIWLTIPFWDAERLAESAPRTAGATYRRTHLVWFSLAVASYALLLALSPIGGFATLSRLRLLLVLALVPLVLGYSASRVRYDTLTQRGETRHVAAKAEPMPRTAKTAMWVTLLVGTLAYFVLAFTPVTDIDFVPDLTLVYFALLAALAIAMAIQPRAWPWILVVGVVVGVLSYDVSSWYAEVAIGLIIALCAVSPRATAVAMALFLVAANAPSFNTPFPVEGFAHDVHRYLPEGATVGVEGPIVYVAAVAPADIKLREMTYPPPAGIDAALVSNELADLPLEGFTRVASWNYTFGVTPGLQARVWLEGHVFSHPSDFPESTGLALWLRDNGTYAAGKA